MALRSNVRDAAIEQARSAGSRTSPLDFGDGNRLYRKADLRAERYASTLLTTFPAEIWDAASAESTPIADSSVRPNEANEAVGGMSPSADARPVLESMARAP